MIEPISLPNDILFDLIKSFSVHNNLVADFCNEIMAGCDGTVTSVNVSKGASVSVGDALVTIG